MGFKTASEINEILPEKNRVTLKQDTNEEQKNEEAANTRATVNEILAPDEISLREYDYLLTMPVLSLTKENVDNLQRLLIEKKTKYDTFSKLHIYDIWERDLENFLKALHKQNNIEKEARKVLDGTFGNFFETK